MLAALYVMGTVIHLVSFYTTIINNTLLESERISKFFSNIFHYSRCNIEQYSKLTKLLTLLWSATQYEHARTPEFILPSF